VKLSIIIVLHFCYIYDILQAEVFCDAQNAPNSFFAGSLPRTPMGELMTLPRPLVSKGDTLSLFSTPSTPAASHLELGRNLLQGLRGIDTLK